MKKNAVYYLLHGFLLVTMPSRAQINEFAQSSDSPIFKEVYSSGWVKFDDAFTTSPEMVFEKNHDAFVLYSPYQMKLVRSRQDEYGFTHAKFDQYFNNIKIRGGQYIIHGKNGKSLSGNGHLITPQYVESAIAMHEADALKAALKYIDADKYYWQDPVKELSLKQSKKNKATTYFPKADMAYIWQPEKNKMTLTYSFAIHTFDKGKSGKYFVDASNGEVLFTEPFDYTCDQTTFLSNWYNIKDLWTNDVGVFNTSYDLEDDCQDAVYGVYYTNGVIFNTPDNIWNTDWLRSAAQSLYAIKISYLWFGIFFNRDSHDNDAGNLDITQGFVFPGNSNNNASYSYDEFGDDEIKVGIGDEPGVLDDYNAIDILGHEFTHGITRYEANLDYQMESGALNESFSDIFGEWLEYKEIGFNNWLIGNDRIVNGCPDPLRYMVNPGAQNIGSPGCTKNFNYPNTYQGLNWIPQMNCIPTGPPDGNDYCGVHKNSGVQNQMFYLLSQGGSGWNNDTTCHAPVNHGYLWSVGGIGIDDAARIGYKVLCDYLTNTSGYIDSRNAWVHTAADIFGPCSYQAIQTGRAWYAVGIGPPAPETMTLCNVTLGSISEVVVTTGILETDPACSVFVLPTGQPVYFEAGVRIHLKNGFHSSLGSYFKANVTDCYFANY